MLPGIHNGACAGAAQQSIRAFVIAKARKASSANALASDLHGLGFPSGGQTQSFAAELLNRFAQKKQLSVRSRDQKAA
jgi:hypothetical protein